MLLSEEKMDSAKKFCEKKPCDITGLRFIVSFFLAYKMRLLIINARAAQ
jgi:hypothetical protein